jgi:hypothetical protein
MIAPMTAAPAKSAAMRKLFQKVRMRNMLSNADVIGSTYAIPRITNIPQDNISKSPQIRLKRNVKFPRMFRFEGKARLSDCCGEFSLIFEFRIDAGENRDGLEGEKSQWC